MSDALNIYIYIYISFVLHFGDGSLYHMHESVARLLFFSLLEAVVFLFLIYWANNCFHVTENAQQWTPSIYLVTSVATNIFIHMFTFSLNLIDSLFAKYQYIF
ncbi:hypothetical protein ACJX0J_028293 [Zea mays]